MSRHAATKDQQVLSLSQILNEIRDQVNANTNSTTLKRRAELFSDLWPHAESVCLSQEGASDDKLCRTVADQLVNVACSGSLSARQLSMNPLADLEANAACIALCWKLPGQLNKYTANLQTNTTLHRAATVVDSEIAHRNVQIAKQSDDWASALWYSLELESGEHVLSELDLYRDIAILYAKWLRYQLRHYESVGVWRGVELESGLVLHDQCYIESNTLLKCVYTQDLHKVQVCTIDAAVKRAKQEMLHFQPLLKTTKHHTRQSAKLEIFNLVAAGASTRVSGVDSKKMREQQPRLHAAPSTTGDRTSPHHPPPPRRLEGLSNNQPLTQVY